MKGIYQQIREQKPSVWDVKDKDALVKALKELITDIKEGKIYKDGRFQKI